jgi:predicted ATPase
MPPLLEIDLAAHLAQSDRFPFNLPVISAWEPLQFSAPVTFLVGENGSGKSTLLEALAIAAKMVTVGAKPAHQDDTLSQVAALAKAIKLSWRKRTRRGFYLRAEDFFGYVKHQNRLRQEMQTDLERVDEEYKGRSKMAQDLAKLPYQTELGDMHRRYGEDGLDAYSHGESFLALFQSRFVPSGLYLLDEPEAPLSPLRQLALLSAIKAMVEQEAQFIIATHAPILMAFPGAEILSFDQPPIHPVAFDDLEHVKLTRDFLNNPDSFLRHL